MGDRVDHSLDGQPIYRSTIKSNNSRYPAHELEVAHGVKLPAHIVRVGLVCAAE